METFRQDSIMKMPSTGENIDYSKHFFEANSVPILVIDPENGTIVDSNPAAQHYYGYEATRLWMMKISEINVLTEEKIAKEIDLAVKEQRNFFNFQHRLANGQVRDVEVTSVPIKVNGKSFYIL